MHVNDLLKTAVDSGASDLHLKVGSFPMMRVRGVLLPASDARRLEHEDTVSIAAHVLPAGYRDRFKNEHEVDLAYSVPGLGRFRCNTFQQRGTVGMVFRVVPQAPPTIDSLALPRVLHRIATEERGPVLVTGTTGSGSIHGAVAQGTSQYGMQTFDQSIFALYERGQVSYEEALRWASNVDEFKLKVQGISTAGDMAREQMARTGLAGAGAGSEITRFGR